MGLVGAGAGLVLADILLSGLTISVRAVFEAALVFWLVHLAVSFLALRVLIREPSVAMAGLLAMGSTVVSLIIVNIVVSGLSIRGLSTYVFATLIIWATTALADMAGRRMIRSRRQERRGA